jgi:hypothetical protein
MLTASLKNDWWPDSVPSLTVGVRFGSLDSNRRTTIGCGMLLVLVATPFSHGSDGAKD